MSTKLIRIRKLCLVNKKADTFLYRLLKALDLPLSRTEEFVLITNCNTCRTQLDEYSYANE